MLGSLHPRSWGACPKCGAWLKRGFSCRYCEARDQRRYANPAAPQEDMSITLCPGKGRPQHMVMTKGINPQTGYCIACTPLPKPEPKPAPAPQPEPALQLEMPRKAVLSSELVAAKEERDKRLAAVVEHAKKLRAQDEAAEASRQRERSPAERWLLEELRRGGGAVAAAGMLERARAAGFTEKQLRYARERLPVLPTRRSWKGGWTWVLLDQDSILANEAGASPPDSVAGEESVKSTP